MVAVLGEPVAGSAEFGVGAVAVPSSELLRIAFKGAHETSECTAANDCAFEALAKVRVVDCGDEAFHHMPSWA